MDHLPEDPQGRDRVTRSSSPPQETSSNNKGGLPANLLELLAAHQQSTKASTAGAFMSTQETYIASASLLTYKAYIRHAETREVCMHAGCVKLPHINKQPTSQLAHSVREKPQAAKRRPPQLSIPPHPKHTTSSAATNTDLPSSLQPLSPLPPKLSTAIEQPSAATASAALHAAPGSRPALQATLHGFMARSYSADEDAGAAPGASSLPASSGAEEVDEIDALLDAFGSALQQRPEMNANVARLMSLPCMLCSSAGGDMYMVGLG